MPESVFGVLFKLTRQLAVIAANQAGRRSLRKRPGLACV